MKKNTLYLLSTVMMLNFENAWAMEEREENKGIIARKYNNQYDSYGPSDEESSRELSLSLTGVTPEKILEKILETEKMLGKIKKLMSHEYQDIQAIEYYDNKTKLSAHEEKLEELKGCLSAHEKKLAKYDNALSKQKTKLSAHEEKLEELESWLLSHETKLETHEAKIKALQAKQKKQEIKQLKLKIKLTSQKTQQLQQGDELSQLRATDDNLQRMLDDLKEKYKKLKKKYKKLDEKISFSLKEEIIQEIKSLENVRKYAHLLYSTDDDERERALGDLLGYSTWNRGVIESLWRTKRMPGVGEPGNLDALNARIARFGVVEDKYDVLKFHINIVKHVANNFLEKIEKEISVPKRLLNDEYKINNIIFFLNHLELLSKNEITDILKINLNPQESTELFQSYTKWLGEGETDKLAKIKKYYQIK